MEEWGQAIAAWLLVLRAAGRPSTTIDLREYQLRRLAGAMRCGPWQVTGSLLVAWFAEQSWAQETRRSFRAALRGFYGWAHGVGLVDVDPARALPAIKPSEPNPRPAPEDAYRLALAVAEPHVRLMLRLAAELGMRRGEVAQVHVRDLERDLTGWSLLVHGKGGKLRTVPITDALAAAVRRQAAGGYAFPGQINGHLSPAWVGRLVARALPEAWAMHSLRHRFATIAHGHERDLLVVQELLGHASPVTTRRYIKLSADALRRTVTAVVAAV